MDEVQVVLPPQNCPACGILVDVARELIRRHKYPRPEDIAICTFCGQIIVFTPELTLRKIEPIELFTTYEPIAEQILVTQMLVRTHPRK